MKKTISEIKELAVLSLRGRWTDPVLAALLFFVLYGLIELLSYIPFIGFIAYTVLYIMYSYGALNVYYMNYYRKEHAGVETTFEGFKEFRVFGTLLLMYVYTLLWALLLIVPGIIKSFSYAMTPFILKDNPELSYNAAIEKSMEMMEGNKMNYFLLQLSFIGWFFLSILTLGIGFLWLLPYYSTTMVAYYEELKASQQTTIEESAE